MEQDNAATHERFLTLFTVNEVAMFDKALSDNEIAGLYRAALAEMARPR